MWNKNILNIFIILFSFLLINFALLAPLGQAITEGNLEENPVEDQVDVNLTVEKYVDIDYDREPMEDGLDFLEAEGSTGIYNTNGNSNWENYLQTEIWNGEQWETHPVHDRDGKRQAIVEMFVAANTDIEIKFEFIEGIIGLNLIQYLLYGMLKAICQKLTLIPPLVTMKILMKPLLSPNPLA